MEIPTGKAKIAVILEEEILEKVDRVVKLHVFPNCSRAIQVAVEEKSKGFMERALAEEGLSGDLAAWPRN